jgi:hypothetical protein
VRTCSHGIVCRQGLGLLSQHGCLHVVARELLASNAEAAFNRDVNMTAVWQ